MAKKFPLELVISAVDKFSSGFANFGSKLDRLSQRADRMGKTLSLKLTAPLAAVGLYSLRSAGQLEQLEIRFSSLVGSAEAAADVMERLKTFTAATPFDLPDVANAAAGLLAAGAAADTLEDKLKILGDIAAGSGGRLGDMVPLYTELMIKGKAFTQDLRQFATRGIPIISVLAEQLGKSEAKIFDLASKGKISFKMIDTALRSMTQGSGLFANQMEKQSRSIFGIWEAFKDTVMFAAAQLGQAMVNAVDLGNKLESLGEWIKRLTEAFTRLDPQTQKFIVWAGLAAAAIGPLLVAFGALAAAVAFVWTPLSAIVLLFAGAIALGATLGKTLADMTATFGGWGNTLMIIGGMILDFLILPLQSFLKTVVAIWDTLGTAPKGLRDLSQYSFAEAAANRALAEQQPVVPGQSLNAGQQYSLARAAQRQNAGETKGEISVVFQNPPQGMRASVVENKGTNVTIDQGISMAGGY